MNPSNETLTVHTSTRRLSPSEGMGNKVTISFGEDNQTSNLITTLSIQSTCHSHIAHLLFTRFMHILSSGGDVSARRVSTVTWLSDDLASRIASAASNLGFGTNGFEINLLLVSETESVSVGLSPLLQKFSSLQL